MCVNETLKTRSFPNSLKCTSVRPIYKKVDPFDKKNYFLIFLSCFFSQQNVKSGILLMAVAFILVVWIYITYSLTLYKIHETYMNDLYKIQWKHILKIFNLLS